MNKQRIDKWIPTAYDILKECKIANNNQINKGYRSQISAFGAAISMGSLMSAVAFFSKKGQSEVDRPKLMEAIVMLIFGKKEKNLFEYIRIHNSEQTKEQVLDACIALKLAMNLYELIPSKADQEQKKEE